jgi:hypothetical protein
MILDVPFSEIKPRILPAIVIEIVIFLIIFLISIQLNKRYNAQRINNVQTLYLSLCFLCWAGALFCSIIGKTLQYIYTFDINPTELGIFTNWSLSLFFLNLASYYHFNYNIAIFSIENKKFKKLVDYIILLIALVCLVFPRYFNGVEIPIIYIIKFSLSFLIILFISYIYIKNTKRVRSFSGNKFLLKMLKYHLYMHIFLVMGFIMMIVSSIYGSITDQYYTWGYYSAVGCLSLTAIFGLLGTRGMKEEGKEEFEAERRRIIAGGSESI